MLPGFRVVCATILLAISLVVFGLGAAALLRASHDQFATLPPAQAPREPLLAREGETRQATLALLRVEMMAGQAEAPKMLQDDTPRDEADTASAPVASAPVVATVALPASPSGADGAEPAVAAIGNAAIENGEDGARSAALSADPPPAPHIASVDAGDRGTAAPPARAELQVATRADDKAPLAAAPDGAGCLPAASAPSSQPLAMLADPAQPRADAASPAKPVARGAAIHRAHHAHLRRRHARLRRHRPVVHAQAQAPEFGVQQQASPFFGVPATRAR